MIIIKFCLSLAVVFYIYCKDESSHSKVNDFNHKETDMESKSAETHNHISDSTAEYFLEFSTDLSKLKANAESILSFFPRYKFDDKINLKLEIIHEKEVHIIIVSDDLEFFSHIHPIRDNNGKYSVQTIFPYGGNYNMFVEYKPEGSEKLTDTFKLFVEGRKKPKKVFNEERLIFNRDKLSVSLQNTSELLSGSEMHLPVSINMSGEKISGSDLDNYLGEKAHAVLIGVSDMQFLHVHPMLINNQLQLHLNFIKGGLYRLWIQFQINGILHTVDFVLDVKQSQNSEKKIINHNHHNY